MNFDKLKKALENRINKFDNKKVKHILCAISNRMRVKALKEVIFNNDCIDLLIDRLSTSISINCKYEKTIKIKIDKNEQTQDEVFARADSLIIIEEYSLILKCLEKNDLRVLNKIHFN